MREQRFTTSHVIHTRDKDLFISIEWRYHPRILATYHDPEEPEQVEFVGISNLPDHLEPRRKEVEWLIEDNLADLEDEALEQIEDQILKWREPTHEFS